MKSAEILSGLLLLAMPVTLGAQQVASLEFGETAYTLQVGESAEAFVDASDSLGDFVEITQALWVASDPGVVAVVMDPELPGIATLTAIGGGNATVTVTVQGVSSSVSVTVIAPEPEREPVPDSVLTDEARVELARTVVRLEVERFSRDDACATAVVSPTAGLVVTSYRAIRGGERITAVTSAGVTLGEARVAEYDVAADLVLLEVPGLVAGEPFERPAAPDGFYWTVGYRDCGPLSIDPVRVASADGNSLRLAADLTATAAGAAISDNAGRVYGVALGGVDALSAAAIDTPLQAAVAAVASNALRTARQVTATAGHLFGAVALQSPRAGASARITPLGNTAWPELETEQPLPFTFAGPAGSYNAALLVDGAVSTTRIIRLQAGVTAQVTLNLPAPLAQQPVRQPPPGAEIPEAGGGGGFPLPLLVVGVLGGGVAALLASKKTPPDGNGGGNGGGATKGTITIGVPIP